MLILTLKIKESLTTVLKLASVMVGVRERDFPFFFFFDFFLLGDLQQGESIPLNNTVILCSNLTMT